MKRKKKIRVADMQRLAADSQYLKLNVYLYSEEKKSCKWSHKPTPDGPFLIFGGEQCFVPPEFKNYIVKQWEITRFTDCFTCFCSGEKRDCLLLSVEPSTIFDDVVSNFVSIYVKEYCLCNLIALIKNRLKKFTVSTFQSYTADTNKIAHILCGGETVFHDKILDIPKEYHACRVEQWATLHIKKAPAKNKKEQLNYSFLFSRQCI